MSVGRRVEKKQTWFSIYSPKTVFIINLVQFLANMTKDDNANLLGIDNFVEMSFNDDSTWIIIKAALTRRLLCCQDIEDAIISYNTKFKELWKRLFDK